MRDVLIMAHPGHELLLHHWLETARPLVFALSDGSGGAQQSRAERSKAIIEAAGASVGPVFGFRTDREWYAAILAGDAAPFIEAAEAIAAAIPPGAVRIVVDGVEHFNPLHDLASAVGARVALLLERNGGPAPRLFVYPIERPGAFSRNPVIELRLDEAARARKLATALAYEPLVQEVERVVASATPERFSSETIDRLLFADAFPETLSEEPFYESFGRRRIEAGLYKDLITYVGHVRPLALTIGGG